MPPFGDTLRCQAPFFSIKKVPGTGTLAEKLEISANFLSNIENGKAWVSPKTVSKLALIFKVEPHELFMPAYDISPDTKDILFRYAQETEESIGTVLNELKNKYLGPRMKNG